MIVAGCGDEDEEGRPTTDAGQLTITVDADGPGGEEPLVEGIACGGAAGCGGLEPADFAPIDPATPCTEIYGGPDVVTIEGSLRGEEVSGAFNRSNGCEIERFDRLTPLLRDLFPGYKPGASLKP